MFHENCSRKYKYIKNNLNTFNREKEDLRELQLGQLSSSSYLTRMLREELGFSFIEYLTELRLKKAIDLLESSSKDALICDIAKKVGYSGQHYFSRIFKNKTGLTLKQYKNIKQNELKKRKKTAQVGASVVVLENMFLVGGNIRFPVEI